MTRMGWTLLMVVLLVGADAALAAENEAGAVDVSRERRGEDEPENEAENEAEDETEDETEDESEDETEDETENETEDENEDESEDGDDDDDGDDDNSNRGGSGNWIRARRDLVRDADSPDADAKGYVEVRTRDDRERFKVEVEHLDPGANLELTISTASGEFVQVALGAADGEGEWEVELDTKDGQALPDGATRVAELAGRTVKVLDGNGTLLLEGLVPDVNDSGNERARGRDRDDESGARVKIDLRVKGRTGRERLRVTLKKLPAGAAVTVRVADAAGTLQVAWEGTASRSGRVRWSLDSRRGDTLPVDVSTLMDLAGRSYEVVADGQVVLAGDFPLPR